MGEFRRVDEPDGQGDVDPTPQTMEGRQVMPRHPRRRGTWLGRLRPEDIGDWWVVVVLVVLVVVMVTAVAVLS